MGLQDAVCDSCKDPTDVLFPLYILDEVPTGGCQMVLRYYCKDCFEEVEPAEEDKEKEEEPSDTQTYTSTNYVGYDFSGYVDANLGIWVSSQGKILFVEDYHYGGKVKDVEKGKAPSEKGEGRGQFKKSKIYKEIS